MNCVGLHQRRGPLWVLRAGAAAGLALSAVIHLQLAPGYQQAAPGGLGHGTLFLIQAEAAVLAAVFVLFKGSRTAFAAAAVVALSSLAAVILYRYVQVPAIGPLPSIYEPAGYALLQKSPPGSLLTSQGRRRGLHRPGSPARGSDPAKDL